ncbi:ATP-dependent RecD-like DNA helicase [Atopococcus tabaci]|uniref:SF1B family DNA helicase RecD2 n=1 Tax=Atopococcus tabaci TaxID=269774 RepID=UPI0003FCFA87|nr:ATP-dependent RecD-like DNA helicase [Atopococcus tabaci]
MREEIGLQLDESEERYIIGEVLSVFFQNPSNFYKVLLVRVKETNTTYSEDEIVITGNFGQIKEEVPYRFVGDLTNHPKYGVQFQSERYVQERPSSTEALVAYLSGPRFVGIGTVTATNIVETLGENVIETILDDPDSLQKVSGLNKKKRETIVKVLEEEEGMDQVVLKLNQLGIGNQLAYKIYQVYQEQTLDIIRNNPYKLVEDIENIGFKRADALAEQMGIDGDSPNRIRASISYVLKESCFSSGDTYVESEHLLKEALRVLESSRSFLIEPEAVADQVISLSQEGQIIQEEDRFYLPSLFAAEWGITSSVERMLEKKEGKQIERQDILDELEKLEKTLGITYGKSQKQAIEQAIQSPLFVLTGGPGTGKTTVINGIVSLFAELHDLSLDPYSYKDEAFPILLAAPTGRAAKRMNETTGLPSSTIHRLLGLTGQENIEMDDVDRTLNGQLLIIDEMSMVDTWLANQLFKAIPEDMQVILVGDKDQLPSVGPGQVLHDLIDSERIPKMELDEIYRQDDGSSITTLAHDIKHDRLPEDFRKNQADRSFFSCSADQVMDVVAQVVSKAIEKGFTAQDIQVLAPMYRGPAGIDNLNKMLQDLFNPNPSGRRKEVKHMDSVYRIGDKVLQLVNEPELNVFNGDMGEITGIITAKESENNVEELTIQFDANEVSYTRNEWNKITLAYCCSIHKSQGSEFEMVILPLVRSYHRMLKKDLLYTAITRASRLLILCGEEAAFQQSLSSSSANRKTTLVKRLTTELDAAEPDETIRVTPDIENTPSKEQSKTEKNPIDNEEPVLTAVAVEKQLIDPMIGMENITPYTI